MNWLVENVREMTRLLTEIALSDPISGLFVTVGSLLIVGSVLFVAYLAAGAVVDLVTPRSVHRSWSPRE